MIRDYVPLTPLWLRGLNSLLEAGPEVCVCVHASMKNVCLRMFDFVFTSLFEVLVLCKEPDAFL